MARSASLSRRSSAGTSSRCSATAASITATSSSAARRWKRSAPASRTKRPSYGCGACGTKRTSNTNPRPLPRIALTSGEPAGVGPELCLALATRELPCELICLGDRTLLAARARTLGLAIDLYPYDPAVAPARHVAGRLAVAHEPLAVPSVAGSPDRRNARYVLKLLDLAIDGALTGEFSALVTAPVQKSLINDAGIVFSGHTEYLATRVGGGPPVMLLTTGELRVALATTHLPLRAVGDALSVESLCRTVATLSHALSRWWGIRAPRIAVCGLNPHAGEGGHLGDEEIRIIGPAIERMRADGIRAEGPLPADTV